jgi:DNA repair exonuclease SbcCD nuclease subunit
MVRFLHSADWQLGMTRHYLAEGPQERFSQARFDAIRALGKLADAESCEFMVVGGDVFESNQVDRKTVVRALEAMKEIHIPVYLLPGNHDPWNAGSVYLSSAFTANCPAHVHVISDSTPIRVTESIEIIGAPWTSKRPGRDLVAEALATLTPAPGITRIAVGHGIVDALAPNPDDPAIIYLETAEASLTAGDIHYLALGDRHSATSVGRSGRIWYSGAPEPTDYDEQKPGLALVVNLDREQVAVKEFPIGTWRFLERDRVDLANAQDLDLLRVSLEAIENKERTILKLRLVGAIGLDLNARLEQLIDGMRDLFGGLEIRKDGLTIMPQDNDFADFGYSGFVSDALEKLKPAAAVPGPDQAAAAEALSLLLRLSRADA